MTDFKVGDKVRFIRDNTDSGSRYGHKGFETIITRVYDSGRVEVAQRGLGCGFNPGAYAKDLELITEPARLKVGDRVVHKVHGAGSVRLVDSADTEYPYFVAFSDGCSRWIKAGHFTPENTTKTTETQKASITPTAIVALIENGQPKPSSRPFVHETTESATKEAERLAGKYPGQKFGVYQLVTARIGTVSVAEA